MKSKVHPYHSKPVGDICLVIGGGTPSKDNDAFYNGHIPWATVRDMHSDCISKTDCMITNEGVRQSSTNIIPGGNVVIATRVGLGKVCMLSQDTAINQDLRGIIPKNKGILDPRYLFWWFKSIASCIESEGTGATVKGVKLPFIKSLQIPLPPLPVQERIVAILDEAFAGISQAIANTERNLRNAREVFESYLSEVFTRKGEGWVETSMQNEIDLITGFAFRSGGYTDSFDGIRLLRGDNIIQNAFRWDGVRRWPKAETVKYSHYLLRENDIVLAMDRTWVKAGLKFAQISAEDLPCLLVQRVACLRAKHELDCNFLKFLIGSNVFTRYVLSIQTGLGVPHISGPQILRFIFHKPSLSFQRDIAEKAKYLSVKVQHLETIYQQKLKALQELKQSILQKAFTGELTQDLPVQ